MIVQTETKTIVEELGEEWHCSHSDWLVKRKRPHDVRIHHMSILTSSTEDNLDHRVSNRALKQKGLDTYPAFLLRT
jgi:hypothetical protein